MYNGILYSKINLHPHHTNVPVTTPVSDNVLWQFFYSKPTLNPHHSAVSITMQDSNDLQWHFFKPTLNSYCTGFFLKLCQCLIVYNDSLYSKPTLHSHHTTVAITMPVWWLYAVTVWIQNLLYTLTKELFLSLCQRNAAVISLF
jgi:hypothetical protein